MSDYYETHAAMSRRGKLWHRLINAGSKSWLGLTACSIEIEAIEFANVAELRAALVLCPRCWPKSSLSAAIEPRRAPVEGASSEAQESDARS